MTRVDLFSTVHKGIRALLFELSMEIGRVDVTSTAAVDAVAGRVERVLTFLEEHAAIEDSVVWPELRALDPVLADGLAAEHRALEVAQTDVALAADAIALADLSQRPQAGAQLIRAVNRLVALHLLHMDREETEVLAALWACRDDAVLRALRARMAGTLPRQRLSEWMAIISPALDPVERRLLGGPPAAQQG